MRFTGVELEVGVLWLEAEPESVVEVAGATLSKGDEEAGTKGGAVTRNNGPRVGADEVAGTDSVEVEASTGAVEVTGSALGEGGGEDEKLDGCSTHTS
jgi:hypothetical protein